MDVSTMDRLQRVYDLVNSLDNEKIDSKYLPVARRVVKMQVGKLSKLEKGKLKGMMKTRLAPGNVHLEGILDSFAATMGEGMEGYEFNKKYSGAIATFKKNAGMKAKFSGEKSGFGAEFSGENSGSYAIFSGENSGRKILFSGRNSGSYTRFLEDVSGFGAEFSGNGAGYYAHFYGMASGNETKFSGCMSGDLVRFIGPNSGRDAEFSGDYSGMNVEFFGRKSGLGAEFSGKNSGVEPYYSGKGTLRNGYENYENVGLALKIFQRGKAHTQQEIIKEIFFEGKRAKEMAAERGISMQAISISKIGGLKKLKKILQDIELDEK